MPRITEIHPYIEKYNPRNYQPEVYDFLADFSNYELSELIEIPNFSSQAQVEQSLQKITEIVHSKYTYKKRKKGNLALSPKTIGERGELDCYGFTLALSQTLNMLNINHKIAFANTHAFVLANNYNTFYLLDALSPEISGEISTSNICHEDCIDKNIFSINMVKHTNEKEGNFKKLQFLLEHPWTNFAKNQNRLGSGRSDELSTLANTNIYLRTYSPYDGFKALYAYDQYKVAIEQKKLSTAYYLSKVLHQTYPEIDIRNKPKPAEDLIKKLGNIGLTTLAGLTIDRTATGRQVAEIIAPQIWRAEQYKKLYFTTGKVMHLQQANQILQTLQNKENLSPQQKSLIKGKLTKLSNI